jgi:hypothetical protein
MGTTTLEPPTQEKIRSEESMYFDGDNDDDNYDDLEYLIDSSESRELDDPFHILLLQKTFIANKKNTVPYVANTLNYVLDMPISPDGMELATFARDHGMSCLGVWEREQCLTLAKQLQRQNIVCRVTPYVQGGQRSWQAKNINSDSSVGSSGSGWN